MSRRMKPTLLVVVALLSAFTVGTSAAATSQTGTIRACYTTAASALPGTLHLLSSSPTGRCAGDLMIEWNSAGPQGPAGAAGPKGDPGERGPAGSLAPATTSRISALLRQVAAAEARLAKAKPGSPAERKALLALSRAQRQATAELVAALSD